MTRQPPEGRRAVIVGNGPSADALPPAALAEAQENGWLLIGTNRVLVFEALLWTPWDAIIIHDTHADLWKDPEVGHLYHELHWKRSEAWRVGPAAQRTTECDEYVRFSIYWRAESEWDSDDERACLGGQSPVLAANWAFLQGVREVALIGCEYSGGGLARMVPPFGGQPTAGPRYDGTPPEACIEKQFERALLGFRAGGGRMVNCSPGTLLESVPFEPWDEVVR